MADHLTVTPRDGLGIVSIMARRGVDRGTITAALGADLPDGPRAIFAGPVAALGAGPGAWLMFEEGADPDFADGVAQKLAGLASVSDQSSSYSVQRLSGPAARTLLQRGAAIDLHPAVFGPGSAATTVIAHIGVILWQVDDRPSYDVATFRSYSVSFRHWLDEAIAALDSQPSQPTRR